MFLCAVKDFLTTLFQLHEKWGKANLFTRPRRFGKSLSMSMLRYFFEIGTDPSLFDGLYIAEKKNCVRNTWENTLLYPLV